MVPGSSSSLLSHFQDSALQPHQHEALLLLGGFCAPSSAASAGYPAVFRILHGTAPHEGVWAAMGALYGAGVAQR